MLVGEDRKIRGPTTQRCGSNLEGSSLEERQDPAQILLLRGIHRHGVGFPFYRLSVDLSYQHTESRESAQFSRRQVYGAEAYALNRCFNG